MQSRVANFSRNGRERESAEGDPTAWGINAYLSRYGNQHLNDNECLRAALKELSYSASSQFENVLRRCRLHLVYSPGGSLTDISVHVWTEGDMLYIKALDRDQVQHIYEKSCHCFSWAWELGDCKIERLVGKNKQCGGQDITDIFA